MAENTYSKSLLFTPEGVRDIYGEDCENRNKIQNEIHDTMKLYGFRDIQTPTFEFFDIFKQERGTVGSKEMFKFFDQYNNTLVLRPDITPSIARCVAKYYDKEDMQIRLCYVGSTFIHQSGYQGKLSETTQVGAELMNDDSSDADGEMIAMTIECLQKTGLEEFKVDIGHADLFRGLVEEASLTEEESEQLKIYLSNKNSFAVEDLLGKKDIPAGCKELLTELPDLFGGAETISHARKKTKNTRALEALERLEKLYEILHTYGMEEHITFDLSMLSHYEYYTGVIFKAYTYGTGDAIATGGRYDNLVEQFGKKTPAIGLAFVLDELMAALNSQRVSIDAREADILILYRSANRKAAIELGNDLRAQNKPVRLMRKNAEISLEEYREYGLRGEVASILYIDDTGEITEFNLQAPKNGGDV
ncbi:MAG: ATP phosphoribosyltransferase regulatory subunit [Lachnospiraceae bacterium]|nr:ATP phosphoribosyltransferase regulatory subunit [Lachnospiraceae bacterium]